MKGVVIFCEYGFMKVGEVAMTLRGSEYFLVLVTAFTF